MKPSVSPRGTPRLLCTQLLRQVKHANLQVRGGKENNLKSTSHTLISKSKGRTIAAAEGNMQLAHAVGQRKAGAIYVRYYQIYLPALLFAK